MTLEREAVIWGYRLMLGRDPESETAIERHQQHSDWMTFRSVLANSPEYKRKLVRLIKENCTDTSADYERDCVVFLHVAKSAGTTLHELLQPHFQPERTCPERFNVLHGYTPGALSRYDFYSGHYDLFSLRYVPRKRVRVVTLFREPRERLKSLYYFYRLHATDGMQGQNRLVELANQHDIEAFFELPEVRSSAAVWNAYALALGANLACGRWENAIGNTEGRFRDLAHLERSALMAMSGLAAYGVVERMEASVRHIFRVLGLPMPLQVPHLQSTDQLPEQNPRLRRVERAEPSARLSRALDELVQVDERLYAEVLRHFDAAIAAPSAALHPHPPAEGSARASLGLHA